MTQYQIFQILNKHKFVGSCDKGSVGEYILKKEFENDIYEELKSSHIFNFKIVHIKGNIFWDSDSKAFVICNE